jgi:uncharacterized protein YgiM (DUF1202 family)
MLLFLLVGWLVPADQVIKYRVSYSSLNFRSGPGTTYRVLGVVSRGDLLELIKKSGKWVKVVCRSGKLKGTVGYLHRDYLKIEESLPRKNRSLQKKRVNTAKPSDYTRAEGLSTVEPADLQMLKKIQKKTLSQSLLFLGLIKQMEPALQDSRRMVKRIPRVKVIKSNAVVLDGFVRGSGVIHHPYINESFTVIEEGDDFHKIRLSGRRTGWISKSFVQYYQEAKTQAVVKFRGVNKNEVSRLLDQLAELNNLITAGKNVADSIISKYNPQKIRYTQAGVFYRKINKYYRYMKSFYEKFRIEDNILFYGSKSNFFAKLRLWGELMLGMETVKTVYAGNSNSDKVSGAKHNLSLGTEYRLNRDLALYLNLSSKREVMLETFTNTNFNSELKYSGVDNLDLSVHGGLNIYSNPDNLRTAFNQFNLGTDLKYSLSGTSDLSFNYSLNSYNYSNDADNNYAIHSFAGGWLSKLSSKASLLLNLLFETESGDLPNHNFSHLKPNLSYIVRNDEKFFKTRILLDTFKFPVSSMNDYSKISAELGFGNNSKEFMIGGYSKSFPVNAIADYFRLMLRITRNSRDYKKRLAFSVYTNFFSNATDLNYTDFHFEISSLSKVMLTSFNILFKYWHDQGRETLGQVVKPYVLDLYCKLGFNFKYLVIGPVIGVHGNIAFNDGNKLFKRDGNLLRIGGFADLNLPLSDKLKIIGRGTFEYGNIYTNNYTGFNDITGDITIDGVYLRHPTTLHINASAQYQLNSSLNIFARGGYYLIDTGFESIPGMYPVDQNSRFYLVGGARFFVK